ncbi:MAG: phage Gp37/Gp68 family protein [Planctomycetota bacterium]
MSNNSAIEWTESTWNPVTGCTKISLGCQHCYAERMAIRLKAMGQLNYINGFLVTVHENALQLPLMWKSQQVIFVNSMSDLFHENVPLEFIKKVFNVMNHANWHQYQVLTKRTERLSKLNQQLQWADHIWMGVSIESKEYFHRIDDLRQTDAHVKFLSLEPLLGALPNLDLTRIDWVIVGGESGPGARLLKKKWVVDIRNQCEKAGVPFFFKQRGGVNKKKAGRLLDGRVWNEMPAIMMK